MLQRGVILQLQARRAQQGFQSQHQGRADLGQPAIDVSVEGCEELPFLCITQLQLGKRLRSTGQIHDLDLCRQTGVGRNALAAAGASDSMEVRQTLQAPKEPLQQIGLFTETLEVKESGRNPGCF